MSLAFDTCLKKRSQRRIEGEEIAVKGKASDVCLRFHQGEGPSQQANFCLREWNPVTWFPAGNSPGCACRARWPDFLDSRLHNNKVRFIVLRPIGAPALARVTL